MYNFDKVIERRHTNSIKYDNDHVQGEGIIPMWVADMDFETLPEIKEALVKRAQHGVFGYAKPTNAYRQAVGHWMKERHHFEIQPEWIVPVPGVVTALKLAVRAYTKPQEKVMIMKPVYHPFDISVNLNDRVVVECPLVQEGQTYICDFDMFERQIIEQDVKLFILCHPHNPIGKVWSREELHRMGTICQKHRVIIISDEIHMDFVYQGQHIPFYQVDQAFQDMSIICTSPSKTFNLAALQVSNILIANKTMRETFIAEKQMAGVSDPNIFGLEACEMAYTYGAQWVDELLDYMQGNIEMMKSFLAQRLPMLKMMEPQGLYLMWIDMHALGMDSKTLETFLVEKARLVLNHGHIFGTGGDGFERMNIACPRSVLKQALEQLEQAIKEYCSEHNCEDLFQVRSEDI